MKQVSIQVVEGGFILDTAEEKIKMTGGGVVETKTEVFVSSAKLMKAVKTFLDSKQDEATVSQDA